MDILRYLPFCEDVKRIIIEYDPYPKELHSILLKDVLFQLKIRKTLGFFNYKLNWCANIICSRCNKYYHFRTNQMIFHYDPIEFK